MKHTIDAKGKAIGRVATEAARYLNGKMSPTFERNKKDDVVVTIINASGMTITQKKARTVKHIRYSGYPGGKTETPLAKVIEKKGYGELIKHAVKGMLPANKLRPLLMKNLIITE